MRIKMFIREAQLADIKQMQIVRHSVTENVLSDPSLVTDAHYQEFIEGRGKGWVCEVNREIVGFAVVDLKENNIWALFLKPEFEKRGIGKKLHDTMLDWYFQQTTQTVWLGTTPQTRAENFYRKAGWRETGRHKNQEIRFEMSYQDWINYRKKAE